MLGAHPTLTNQYYAELIQAIEDYADSLDYRVIVCNTFRKPDLEKVLSRHLCGQPRGRHPLHLSAQLSRLIEQIAVTTPTVIIGGKSRPTCPSAPSSSSNVSAGAMLAESICTSWGTKAGVHFTPSTSSPWRASSGSGIRRQLESHGIMDGLEVLVAERQAEQDSRDDGLPYEYSVGRQLTAELHPPREHGHRAHRRERHDGPGHPGRAHGPRLPCAPDFSVCGFDNIFPPASPRPPSPPSTTTCAPAASRR